MYKIWKLQESKSNKIILIKDKIIYKGNPKENDLKRLNPEVNNFSLLKELFSIPYSYIRKVENQSGKNFIKIFFGNDSTEELYFDDDNIKNEVFDFIKNDNPNLKYSSKTPSDTEYAKGQIFALFSVTGIFCWSEFLAYEIEKGTKYEIVGGGNPGISGIVLAIANLGSFNIIIGYLVLLGIIIYSMRKKIKSKSEIQFLVR